MNNLCFRKIMKKVKKHRDIKFAKQQTKEVMQLQN